MRTVIVIGAGPAGLGATEAALKAGARVTLLDAAPRPGGQFWRHGDERLPQDMSLQHNWRRFTALDELIRSHPQGEFLTRAQVWAIDHDQHDRPVVHAAVGPADGPDREMRDFRADALIVATGAHDTTLPFPGWDLPGVFTGGAAQAMAKAEQVAVGRQVVVAGAGPFLLPVAASIASTGARVLGIYEASTAPTAAAGWLPHSPWLAGKAPELAGYVAKLLRNKINYRLGRAVIAVHGESEVDGVTISRIDRNWRPVPGTETYLECDAVCVSHGFTPRLELAIAAGCVISPDRFVQVDSGQRTSVPGVFAAGETTGIGGADLALAEGRIAGHLAAGGTRHDPELRRDLRARHQLRHLAEAVRNGHRIGSGWIDWLAPDTVICRCEEVRYQQLQATVADTGARGLRSVKLSTRAGLGPCQGRICGRTVEMIITDGGRRPILDNVRMDRRPIAAPVRFSELADHPTGAPDLSAVHQPDLPGGKET